MILASGLVLASLAYTVAMFLLSRRGRGAEHQTPDGLFFVFVVPCLDEELVVGSSLDRLLSLEGSDYSVLVVDDGSTDATAEIVRARAAVDPRVWLLQRTAPEARQGKGEALNAAYRHLLKPGVLRGRHVGNVVVAIVDADGRVAPNVLHEVGPFFSDERTGGVQIGVRMYNAEENLLARLQDVEFVTFGEMFQRARQHTGSVGLGGNGQFTRLAALLDLGESPWTDYLTEDLDLGLRILANGWRNQFCPTTSVSQQAVVRLGPLVRQRARWFQGHLQCWSRLKLVLQSDRLSDLAAFDLVFHLLAPSLVLVMVLPSLTFLAAAANLVAAGAHQGTLLKAIGLTYVMAFAPAPVYGVVYWLQNPDVRLRNAIGYAHAFCLYSFLWVFSGWWAVGRIARGSRGWAKTGRTATPGSELLTHATATAPEPVPSRGTAT